MYTLILSGRISMINQAFWLKPVCIPMFSLTDYWLRLCMCLKIDVLGYFTRVENVRRIDMYAYLFQNQLRDIEIPLYSCVHINLTCLRTEFMKNNNNIYHFTKHVQSGPINLRSCHSQDKCVYFEPKQSEILFSNYFKLPFFWCGVNNLTHLRTDVMKNNNKIFTMLLHMFNQAQ